MGAVIFKIWYFIVILPFLIFLEGSKMLTNFLKKRNIYTRWDVWHSFLLTLVIIYLVLIIKGTYYK